MNGNDVPHRSSNSDPTPQRSGRPVTSYDVAKYAGVSQSAVSRCFKPGASVSRQMRARVMKAAEELGYQPNAIARSLITRRSNLVAVVLSEFTNLSHPEVLYELNQGFAEAGIHLMLFTVRREREIEDILARVSQYQVDGVVVAASLSAEQISGFEKRQTPVVLFNRTLPGSNACSVCCDHVAGERQLVDALVNSGHSSFAIITGPGDSEVSVQRTHGLLARLNELGHGDVAVAQGDYTYASGAAGLLELMASGERAPDALLCANDVMAVGAIDAARRELSLRVPEDLSVAGFDGIVAGSWASYNLLTIRQPIAEMARATVDLITARIESGATTAETRLFQGEMRAGSSARI